MFFLKKTQKLNASRNHTCSVNSAAILLPLAILKTIQVFFSGKLSFFRKKTQILNIMRNPTLSVAFSSKFATFSHIGTIYKFFWKTHLFLKNTKFELLENSYSFIRNLQLICYLQPISETSRFLSKNSSIAFSFKKKKILKDLRKLTISDDSMAVLLPLAIPKP